MSVNITQASVPEGLGFQATVQLPATRYRQGGVTLYDVIVDIPSLTRAVLMPDPAKPLEDNRVVKETRARQFGVEYVLNADDAFGWVCPPLTVRIEPGDVKVTDTVAEFDNGSAWVVLELPSSLLWRILDGQHRALGFEIGLQHAADAASKLRAHIHRAKKNGSPKKLINEAEKDLDALLARLDSVKTSHVSVTMMVATSDQGRQAFVDIARNAKGVNPDFTVVLDQRSPVHRIAMDLTTQHSLLVGLVEDGQSRRMSKTSDKLLGAKTVADIVHATLVGGGRVSRRKHDEISRDETSYRRKVEEFFDGLTAGFTEIKNISDESTSPQQLRATSLLGSATMLRVLAVVWHKLREQGIGAGSIEQFWSDLEPSMSLGPDGIEEDDLLWMPTGAFLPGANAPQARAGNINQLATAIESWYHNGIPARA